jgi:hypothetical protein
VFERFTDRSRQVLVFAQEEAVLLHHNFLGTEHILLGLVREGEGPAARALASLGITLDATRESVRQTIGPAGSAPSGSPPFTPRSKKVLELSLREALQLGHNYIGTEHLLLGLVREGEGVAVQVLQALGASPERVRERVVEIVGNPPGSTVEGAVSPIEPHPTGGPRLVRCSFCGRLPPEAGRLMAGIDAFICEACADQCRSAFQRLGGGQQTHSMSPLFATGGEPTLTGPPPENEAEARRSVEAAFSTMYDRSQDGAAVPAVEGGANLGPALDEAGRWARARGGFGPATVSVDRISFLNATEAAVWFSLDSGGRTVYRYRRGRAVRTEQGWKVSRETFCGLLAGIGVSCPPPP